MSFSGRIGAQDTMNVPLEKLTGRGAYVVALEVHDTVRGGRLGRLAFDGCYGYVGSALGPGGFRRVSRHLSYRGRPVVRPRWHIDWLLAAGRLQGAVLGATEERVECALARALSQRAEPVSDGFGCSDCACATHLYRFKGVADGLGVAEAAMREMGLTSKTLRTTG